MFIILNLQTYICVSLRGMELVSTEEEQKISKQTSAFRRMTTRRKTTIAKPSLSRYDGIRFHIKKRGKFPNRNCLLLQKGSDVNPHQGMGN